MTLTIEEGTVPSTLSTRTREPNPFAGKFPTEEGKSLIVRLPSRNDEEKKYVEKVKAQAQTAARDSIDEEHPSGFTARVKLEPCKVTVTEKGKNGRERTQEVDGTCLTIWTVARIHRAGAGRKPAADKPAEQVAADNQNAAGEAATS